MLSDAPAAELLPTISLSGKKVKTKKYETPVLVALIPALDAIQGGELE
jgi:hypothetical protein